MIIAWLLARYEYFGGLFFARSRTTAIGQIADIAVCAQRIKGYVGTTGRYWTYHSLSIDAMGGHMSNELQGREEMDFLENRTQELKQRITTLKELITTMVAEKKETKHQSELLVEMLHLLDVLKKFEGETLKAFTAYDSHSRVKPNEK